MLDARETDDDIASSPSSGLPRAPALRLYMCVRVTLIVNPDGRVRSVISPPSIFTTQTTFQNAPPDVLDLICARLLVSDTLAFVACASSCRALRSAFGGSYRRARLQQTAIADLVAKVDLRLFASKFGEKRRPLGVARAVDFLVPFDPQRPRGRLRWVAGSLYLPWSAEGRADGLRWREAGLDAADARTAAAALAASPHLLPFCEVQDWGANPIGDDGALALASVLLRSAPRLSALELAGCGLTDRAAKTIAATAAASAPQLRRLILGSNPIGDSGCAALAAALASLPQLAVLQLGDTEVGDAGAASLAAALDAQHAEALLQLWLASTLITPNGRLALGMAEVRHQARSATLHGQRFMASLRVCW